MEGFVSRQIDHNHIVIRVQEQEFNAETQIPLPTGAKVSLRVEEVAPRVVLRLAPAGEEAMGSEILSFIKKALPFNIPLDQLASRVASLLSSPEGKMPARVQEAVNFLSELVNRFSLPLPSNPEEIRGLISSAGLFWENRLKGAVEEGKAGDLKDRVRGDIKGVLSVLKQELEQASAESGEIGTRRQMGDLLKGVDSYLRKIELYQLLNASSSEEGQRFHLVLPFMFGQDFCFGELDLSLPEEGKGESSKEESALTFLLSWPEGGKVRIDVKVREERILGQFQTNDPKWKGLLEEGMEELAAKLQSLGLRAFLQVAAEPLDPGEKTIAGGMEEKIPDLLSILV